MKIAPSPPPHLLCRCLRQFCSLWQAEEWTCCTTSISQLLPWWVPLPDRYLLGTWYHRCLWCRHHAASHAVHDWPHSVCCGHHQGGFEVSTGLLSVVCILSEAGFFKPPVVLRRYCCTTALLFVRFVSTTSHMTADAWELLVGVNLYCHDGSWPIGHVEIFVVMLSWSLMANKRNWRMIEG